MVICRGVSVTSECDHITEELIHCYIVDLSGSHSAARLTYYGWDYCTREAQCMVCTIVSTVIIYVS